MKISQGPSIRVQPVEATYPLEKRKLPTDSLTGTSFESILEGLKEKPKCKDCNQIICDCKDIFYKPKNK
jgi:hypothetical protein